jgi:hypothetical protein
LLSAAVLLLVGSRICQGAETESPPASRQVELVIGATTNEADLLESSVGDLLKAKGLTVEATREKAVTAQDVAAAIAPPKEATPSLARILVDLSAPRQATLFLIDPRRGRVHVRRMPLAHGLDAVARASVRFVVEQSIDAILEGRDIGVSREEFQRSTLPPAPAAEVSPVAPVLPPPPPAPSAPTPSPPGRQWLVAGGYEAVAMGSGEVQQALEISVSRRLAILHLGVAARFAAPTSVSGDGAEARLSTEGASVWGAAEPLASENLSLRAGLGAGLDFTRVAPAVTTAGLQPAAAFWAASPWLQPFAALEWTLGRISVAISVGAELHPLDERYTVKNGAQASDVFVPWRLRPAGALLVGVAF